MIFVVPALLYQALEVEAADSKLTVNELCRQRAIGRALREVESTSAPAHEAAANEAAGGALGFTQDSARDVAGECGEP